MFGYRVATTGLKSLTLFRTKKALKYLPCVGLCKTTPSILGSCLGQMTKYTPCLGQKHNNYIPCSGQRGQKPYPIQRHVPI